MLNILQDLITVETEMFAGINISVFSISHIIEHFKFANLNKTPHTNTSIV